MNLLTRVKKSNIQLTNAAGIKQMLVGKKVEIIGNSGPNGVAGGNTHGLQIGKQWTLTSALVVAVNGANPEFCYITDASGCGSGGGIYLHNIKLIGGGLITVNDFNAEIQLIEEQEKALKADKQKAKDIIKFMQENEIGEFDEKVYEIYKVIKKLKSGTTDIEKAIEVAKLLEK